MVEKFYPQRRYFMNNDFESNKRDDIDINENNGKEMDNGTENAQNIGKSEEEGRKIPQDQEKTAQKEEPTAGEQEKAASKESENNAEEGRTAGENSDGDDLNNSKTYSANYAPPNYTPDFTIVDSTKQSGDPKKEKKLISLGAVVAICSLTLVLSLLLGALAGAVAGGGISLNLGNRGKDIVNIITSDREVVVEEIPIDTEYDDLSVAQVAALVSNQVVEITTAQKKTNGSYIQSGAGSGVIYGVSKTSGQYYIVTNYHVIEDTVGNDGKIVVRVKNDRSEGEQSKSDYHEYEATYYAGDQREDIAVLTITPRSGHVLSCAVFTDSSKLSVGEEVVAIGNPLGTLGGTVTNGIISALDREITVGNYPMTLLQTNAAINPGNSGGGLFDMKGRLVGIVNAKQSSSGIEGLGFAIPSNIVKKAVEDLLEYKYIRDRAALGITIQQSVNPYFGTTAIYVAADNAEGTLIEGDKLLEVNGKTVSSMSDCYFALKNVEIGDVVKVKVLRGISEITVEVTTVEYKPES